MGKLKPQVVKKIGIQLGSLASCLNRVDTSIQNLIEDLSGVVELGVPFDKTVFKDQPFLSEVDCVIVSESMKREVLQAAVRTTTSLLAEAESFRSGSVSLSELVTGIDMNGIGMVLFGISAMCTSAAVPFRAHLRSLQRTAADAVGPTSVGEATAHHTARISNLVLTAAACRDSVAEIRHRCLLHSIPSLVDSASAEGA